MMLLCKNINESRQLEAAQTELDEAFNWYSYPDKFCPACVGRAARALASKARAARPTGDVHLSGTAASEKTYQDNYTKFSRKI